MMIDRESLELSWGNFVYQMMEKMEECDGKFMSSSLLAVLCSIYGEKIFEIGQAWPYYEILLILKYGKMKIMIRDMLDFCIMRRL